MSTKPLNTPKFDAKTWARLEWSERFEAVCRLIDSLPRYALAAFALRCAKRVEPLARLQPLIADAYSAGLDISKTKRYAGLTADIAVRTAAAAAVCADNADAWDARDAYGAAAAAAYETHDDDDASVRAAAAAAVRAYDAYATYDTYVAYDAQDAYDSAAATADTAAVAVCAADADAATAAILQSLNLGRFGEPGEPIRWNDLRLGPLWPHGEPKWYTEAVQMCRELEEKLRTLPDPNAPPPDPALDAQWEDREWLDQLRGEGKLAKYRGEYVIAAEKQILAHGQNLVKVHPKAEKIAQKKRISLERLVLYFVPGLE